MRVAIAFQRYAQMQVRRFGNIARVYVESMAELRNPKLTPRQKWRIAHTATRRVLNLVGGVTTSGVLSYFATALATGGGDGVVIAWNEASDKPLKFLWDSFAYTMFAGPYGAILRHASGNSENPARMVFPLAVLMEGWDAVTADGKYADAGRMERFGKLIESFAPVNKLVATGLAVAGFNTEAHQMDTAVRAYWRWRFDAAPPTRMESPAPDAAHQQFRRRMHDAYVLMRSGEPPEAVLQELRRAAAAKGKGSENVAASLRSKRLLAQLKDDQKHALKQRIGEGAYARLEAHDRFIETIIPSVTGKASKAKRLQRIK